MEKNVYFIKKLKAYKIKSVKETENTYQFEVESTNQQSLFDRMYFTKESFKRNNILNKPEAGDILIVDDNQIWIEKDTQRTIIIADDTQTKEAFISEIKDNL